MLYRFLLLPLIMLGLSSSLSYAEEVTVHGSTTVTYNMIAAHKAAIESQSGQMLNVVANGSGEGLRDLVTGKTQIAMISAPLEEVAAKLRGFTTKLNTLVAHQVGETKVAFTTHKSNSTKSLTRAQVKDIMAGRITKWSDVGGPAFPIYVITERVGGGLRTIVETALFEGTLINAKMKELPSAMQIPKVVASMPAAFGIMSGDLVDDTVGVVTLDKPIVQPMFFVTKANPSPAVKAVIDAARKATGHVEPAPVPVEPVAAPAPITEPAPVAEEPAPAVTEPAKEEPVATPAP